MNEALAAHGLLDDARSDPRRPLMQHLVSAEPTEDLVALAEGYPRARAA